MCSCGRTRKGKGYLQNEHSDIIKEDAFVQTLHEYMLNVDHSLIDPPGKEVT